MKIINDKVAKLSFVALLITMALAMLYTPPAEAAWAESFDAKSIAMSATIQYEWLMIFIYSHIALGTSFAIMMMLNTYHSHNGKKNYRG